MKYTITVDVNLEKMEYIIGHVHNTETVIRTLLDDRMGVTVISIDEVKE